MRIASKIVAMTTKPFSVLSEPLLEDPDNRRRIKIYRRAMEKSVTLGEHRRDRRVLVHRFIKKTQKTPDDAMATARPTQEDVQ